MKNCEHNFEKVGLFSHTERWRCKKCGHEKPFNFLQKNTERGKSFNSFFVLDKQNKETVTPHCSKPLLCDEKSFICEKEWCNNDIVCNNKKQCMWKQV